MGLEAWDIKFKLSSFNVIVFTLVIISYRIIYMENSKDLSRFDNIKIRYRPIGEDEKLVTISKTVNGNCMEPILKDRERVNQEAISTTSPREGDVGIILRDDGYRRFGIWGPLYNNEDRMILSPNEGVGHGQIQFIHEKMIQLMIVIGRLNDKDYNFLLNELRII